MDEDVAAQALERLATINAEIDTLTTEANDIKAWLRENVGNTTGTRFGSFVVRISPRKTWSEAMAKETLPSEWLALCVAQRVDREQAKRVLPQELYERCCVDGTPAVSVSV